MSFNIEVLYIYILHSEGNSRSRNERASSESKFSPTNQTTSKIFSHYLALILCRVRYHKKCVIVRQINNSTQQTLSLKNAKILCMQIWLSIICFCVISVTLQKSKYKSCQLTQINCLFLK